MIYAIDNGEFSVEDHEIEFVESGPEFGEWWKAEFAPWLKLVRRRDHILFNTDHVIWWMQPGNDGMASPISTNDYIRYVNARRDPAFVKAPRYDPSRYMQLLDGAGI